MVYRHTIDATTYIFPMTCATCSPRRRRRAPATGWPALRPTAPSR